jgi:hypothetical protein
MGVFGFFLNMIGIGMVYVADDLLGCASEEAQSEGEGNVLEGS